MKKALLFCALLLFVAANGISQDLLDGDDDDGDVLVDDLLGKIYDDESSKWWNKEWKYRRRIEVTDPEIPVRGVVLLHRPDPLLLYNTGRCLDELADLRVISREGKILPSGVLNFGCDDGSSYIWCTSCLPPPLRGENSKDLGTAHTRPVNHADGFYGAILQT